jgi:plasmid stability protein
MIHCGLSHGEGSIGLLEKALSLRWRSLPDFVAVSAEEEARDILRSALNRGEIWGHHTELGTEIWGHEIYEICEIWGHYAKSGDTTNLQIWGHYTELTAEIRVRKGDSVD